MVHYIYIIDCDKYDRNGCFDKKLYYTGETWNVPKRYKEHRQGIRSNWMSRNNISPKGIVCIEIMDNKSDALKRETQIKNNQKLKLRLIREYSLM